MYECFKLKALHLERVKKKRKNEYGRGGVRKFVYDVDRPAVLKGDLVGLCVDGKWEI